MIYTTSVLNTLDDCNALLAIAAADREELDFKKYNLERKHTTSTSSSTEIETELAAVEAEIAAYEAVLVNMPEGAARTLISNKLTKANYKKFTLEERRNNYGVLAVMQQEFDIACLEASIEESDAFIEALNERKAEL